MLKVGNTLAQADNVRAVLRKNRKLFGQCLVEIFEQLLLRRGRTNSDAAGLLEYLNQIFTTAAQASLFAVEISETLLLVALLVMAEIQAVRQRILVRVLEFENLFVQLGKLAAKPLNFLILDEPTHHLDIQSKDVLKEALKNYDGTFLLVSHDRDFLTGLTDRLLELDEWRIRDQHMDILELIEKRKALQGADIGKSSSRVKEVKTKGSGGQHDRRDRDKEVRKARQNVERLEKQLATLEGEEKELQASVMKGQLAPDAVQAGYAKLGQLAQRIAGVMEEWEAASQQLDALGQEASA